MEILKECYKIIVKQKHDESIHKNLKKILEKEHKAWTNFDKMDIKKLLENNEEFI